MAYNRYKPFTNDGKVGIVPFIPIPKQMTDFYVTYQKGKDRLDIMSYNYYGDCDYGWVILQANPEYGSLEFDIPDGAKLRIPYPVSTALELYENGIMNYREKYGNRN